MPEEAPPEDVISSKSRQRTRRGEAIADPAIEVAEEAVQESARKVEDAELLPNAAAASSPGRRAGEDAPD
jgi:hypothetical protein